MNNQLKFNIRRISLYYYNFRYSAYFPTVMPIIVTVVGLLAFIVFILPQFNNWFSVQKEVEATQARIKIMRDNGKLLSNLDKSKIDRDFLVVTEALPSVKDFMGILNSISKAALVSYVSVSDYEFTLGKVSSKQGIKVKDTKGSPVNINLKIDGSIKDINNFMLEIEKQIPLAEIKTVNFAENKADLLMTFYMKAVPDLNINYSDPLATYTQDEREVLQSLYLWSER